MSENFGQNLLPNSSTGIMSGVNTPKQNTGFNLTQSGFLSPGGQDPFKTNTNLLTSTPAPSATKAATSTPGNPTLFSWPASTTSAPATTSTAFTNFKGNSPSTTTGGLTFKAPAAPAMQNKPLTTSNPTSLSGGGFNLGSTAPATTSTPGLPSFGIPATSKPASTSAPSTFNLIKPTSTVASPISQTTSSTTTTVASGLGLTSTATTTSLTSSALSAKPATSVAPTTTTSGNAQPQSLNFQQLEELILNKWTAELYEQEKVFLNQATQINIWDKVINENAEKLTLLHSTMEKVRKQQTKINDDLDVINSHQKDLELSLAPMEKEDLLSVLKADPNRKNLYSNAKKIDSQIKSMSENLKETIEHINETSRSHDTEDPVIQVGRILNAHMESLRWIDEHTARMQDYFDSLLKIHDDLRRECDLNKHDVY